MKTTKRSWLIRIAFILVLVLIAVVMLRIGRGHTVYFDNRAVDKGGQSVEAPYKITVYVNGEQISKLYEKERCLTTVIGDKLELTVEVMQQMILVIYVELAQRRIPVQYTRRMIGRKMYGGSSTYLPLKINMSGVIPPIFASSILAVPTLIAQFGNSDQSWVKWINSNLANTTSVWYIALYALMIVFFCFFYTEITFNPDETADNMKQYGGFIPGIRAGSATSNYLSYVMNRLNTVGAVYLLFVALIPTVLIMALNLNTKLPFGGTTILIIAGVGLDTLRQAKAQTEQFQYAGFLFEDTDHKEGK